jgi:N-acetylglucosamine kinase-like BadF-type ATPase
MPEVLVGVDAGGTGTVAAVATDERVHTHLGPPANASSLGARCAGETIAETILTALDGALPDAVFVGAAGAGRESVASEIEETIRERFPRARVRVRDDAHIALRASVPEGPGAVLICGTGSMALAENGNVAVRCGGYGFLVGDDGSGYAIGAAAIKLLLRHYDGRGPRDAFVDAVEGALDVRSLDEALERVYGAPNAVAQIARLAPLVVDAAGSGERSANKIVQAAALELSELVKTAVKRADLAQTEVPIVFSGGLLETNSMLTYLLETRLQNDFPNAHLRKERVEPYRGALAAAARLLTDEPMVS